MTAATQIPGYLAGTWDIDPVHSAVSFSVRHMMVSKVRGHFNTFSGVIVTAADFGDSTVTATVDATTLDTANAQRDGHVKSADFFEVEKYPTWEFVSTSVTPDTLAGNLTIKGVTKPITFDLTIGGFGPDAWGGTRVGFEATGTINRGDYGVDISLPLDGGGVVVSEKVAITLEIEGVLRAA